MLLDVTYITLQPSVKTPEDVQRALDAVAKAAHAIAGAPDGRGLWLFSH